MVFLAIGGIAMGVLSLLFFAAGRKRKVEVNLNNSVLPTWIFDRETLQFLAVNNAAIKLYGYTENEFLQKTIKDIRIEWDVDKLQEHIGQQPLAGKNTGIWKHCKKNGEIILVRVTADDTMFKGKRQRLITIEDITYTLTANHK